MLPDFRVAGLISIVLAMYLLLPHSLRITVAGIVSLIGR
jgi:hypothetical protein